MKRSVEPEMMDLPGQPRELLAGDLRNLRLINRYLGCHRTVLRGLARVVSSKKLRAFTLLDVGTGSADIPEVIVRWARANRIGARIVALDRDPVGVEEAAEQTGKLPEITVIRGYGMSPPFGAASFDFVLASQLLHHFSDAQILAALRTWACLARGAIIVNDLVRHPFAYQGIRLVTKAFTRNAMTRTDAPRSVERACTISEWRELFRRANVGKFSVQWALPFRVLGVISISR